MGIHEIGYIWQKLLMVPICSNIYFDITHHAHMKRIVSLGVCFMLSLVLIFGYGASRSILPVSAQGEYVIFPETASISSSGLTPLNFMLKAISKPSGDVEKVSGFKIDPVNVLSVSTSGVISAVSTDQSIVFEQAKAKSSTDSLFELQKATLQGQPPQPQPNNDFSIAGLAPGVYTLDLIGTKNGAKAAYEGILVIAQSPENPQVKQVVEKEINEVQQDTTGDIITIFQVPPAPQQLQPQPQQLGAGPIAQQLQPGGAAAGPLGAQPQQLAAIPLGGQGQPNQPPSLSPSPPPIPLSPQPQPLAAQPGQCPQGFEGIPPQCTPLEPGNEPVDILSLDPSLLDPNDPLFGEPGGLGEETREGESEDSESDSESKEEGGGNEDGGDSGDNDSGDGGDSGSGDGGGDSGE
jgi:hypothetical protein